MRDGAGTDPEGDGAFALAVLQVIYDQGGLPGIVDVESGAGAVHFDFHFGPFGGDEVHVGFVLHGELPAETVPGPVGRGDVLRAVIAALLVIGAAIGGAQVEAFESGCAGLQAKGNADEAAGAFERSGRRLSGEVEFDHAILEGGALEDGEASIVSGRGGRGVFHAEGLFAFKGEDLGFDLLEIELVERGNRNVGGYQKRKDSYRGTNGAHHHRFMDGQGEPG